MVKYAFICSLMNVIASSQNSQTLPLSSSSDSLTAEVAISKSEDRPRPKFGRAAMVAAKKNSGNQSDSEDSSDAPRASADSRLTLDEQLSREKQGKQRLGSLTKFSGSSSVSGDNLRSTAGRPLPSLPTRF